MREISFKWNIYTHVAVFNCTKFTSDKQLLFLNCNSSVLEEARAAVTYTPSSVSSFKCAIRIHIFQWYTDLNIHLIGLIYTFHSTDRSTWPKQGLTDVTFLNNLVLYFKKTQMTLYLSSKFLVLLAAIWLTKILHFSLISLQSETINIQWFRSGTWNDLCHLHLHLTMHVIQGASLVGSHTHCYGMCKIYV